MPQGSAQYVWGDTNTITQNATLPPCGTDRKAKLAETNKEDLSLQRDLSYVLTGNYLLVAICHHTQRNIVALGAEKLIMVLNHALEQRRNKGLTPYKATAWADEFNKHRLYGKYPDLAANIINGFDLGIQPITLTYTPNNHMSINIFQDAYSKIIEKEFKCSHYLGPFSQREVKNLIGPFHSLPLLLIPKSGKPGKFRAVHNFSYPNNPIPTPSINSTIKADNYPCTWGTFAIISLLISHLPLGSQASVHDVAEAYRTIPARPNQWPGLVVCLKGEDQFAINTNNNFGLTAAGGVGIVSVALILYG